jgi:hypothetical protein
VGPARFAEVSQRHAPRRRGEREAFLFKSPRQTAPTGDCADHVDGRKEGDKATVTQRSRWSWTHHAPSMVDTLSPWRQRYIFVFIYIGRLSLDYVRASGHGMYALCGKSYADAARAVAARKDARRDCTTSVASDNVRLERAGALCCWLATEAPANKRAAAERYPACASLLMRRPVRGRPRYSSRGSCTSRGMAGSLLWPGRCARRAIFHCCASEAERSWPQRRN